MLFRNDHTLEIVWSTLCCHPLCDDLTKDEHALWQHLIDKHGLSHSQPDAVSPRKLNLSEESEFLEWTPKHSRSSSKQSRLATSTISPRVLYQPSPAGYRADE